MLSYSRIMYFVYILRLSNERYYVGQTNDLAQRLECHQSGQSVYTKKFLPVELIYSEEHESRSAAMKREKHLKSLKNRRTLESVMHGHGPFV